MTEFKPLPLWFRPSEPDPRTEPRLAECRRWMALRGIYGPRSVYRPGPGTIRGPLA